MSSVQIMAMESPLAHSPGHSMSAFSPYSDYSASSSSPKPLRSPRYHSMSGRSSSGSSLFPGSSLGEGQSPASANISSPNDLVGPSPVTSNGTETTEIEDDVLESASEEDGKSEQKAPSRADSQQTLKRLSTNIPDSIRSSIDDESVSVIHAPQGFSKFTSRQSIQPARPNIASITSMRPTSAPPNSLASQVKERLNSLSGRSTPIPYEPDVLEPAATTAKIAVISPPAPLRDRLNGLQGPLSPSPISTDITSLAQALDLETPRAHTREEVEDFMGLRAPLSRHGSLEGIPEEKHDTDDDFEAHVAQQAEEEALALKTALHECWTLCNTLASLSSIHRERIFSYSDTGDAHEAVWQCCWRLCKKLYDDRDENHEVHVRPTLDLCRDFCQALFDVRQRKGEVDDSVLRVSFELNNHLYYTHDRSLPEAFRERTLDFYITLCHRLMKQRSDLAEETDALLRACWGLAEMLFSLRQNKRDGKPADEELLGSAIQACWSLTDLFREGWTQVRPERGTPRPSQTTFTQVSDQMARSNHNRTRSLTSLFEHDENTPTKHLYNPETPTTEFEDTPISPDLSPNIPNILVLGSEHNRATSARWSSNASSTSSLSTYSKTSGGSTSTARVTSPPPEDANLTRLKLLILKAAQNVGYTRNPSSFTESHNSPLTLHNFVKSLSTGSFGSLPTHSNLLTSYRNLVLGDPTFRDENSLPVPGTKASAADIAKSCRWMMRRGRYMFLKDLFRLVFGFHVDEAEQRKNVTVCV